jgi:hypothetical protein
MGAHLEAETRPLPTRLGPGANPGRAAVFPRDATAPAAAELLRLRFR